MTPTLAVALAVLSQIPLPPPGPPAPYFNELADFAGLANTPGTADGPALTTARLSNPRWMASTPSGAWVITGTLALSANPTSVIRFISNGWVSSWTGFLPHNVNEFGGLAVDPITNELYFTLQGRHVIMRISPSGYASLYAGVSIPTSCGNTLGQPCYVGAFADGFRTNARFNLPTNLAIDANRDLWVADSGNGALRKISLSGNVSSPLPPIPGFAPVALAIDQPRSRVLFTSRCALYEFPLGGGGVSLIAGVPTQGQGSIFSSTLMIDGDVSTARFASPGAIAVDASGNIFVADTQVAFQTSPSLAFVHTGGIRQVTPGKQFPRHPWLDYPTTVRTLALAPAWIQTGATWAEGHASDTMLQIPMSLTWLGGTLLVSDSMRQTVRQVRTALLPQRL